MNTNRKTRTGQVVGTKMEKTVVVAVRTVQKHPLYGKTLKTIKRYKVHDEEKACKLGDKVTIAETRPISRDKRWRIAEIVARSEVADIQPRDIKEEIERPAAKVEEPQPSAG